MVDIPQLAKGLMLSAGQLFERVREVGDSPLAEVTQSDRDAMAVALVFQGYTCGRAAHMAFVELEDNDGALQMLARHRIAAAPTCKDCLQVAERVKEARISELEDALEDLIPMIWVAQGDTSAAEKVERARDILLKSGTLEPPPSEQGGR